MHLSPSFWTLYCKSGVCSVYALVWPVGLAISIHSLVLFLMFILLLRVSLCAHIESRLSSVIKI